MAGSLLPEGSEMVTVRGRLDLRWAYGAPRRIDQGPGEANEIRYHAIVGGSAVLRIRLAAGPCS